MCADFRFRRNSQSVFLNSGSWSVDKRDYPAFTSPIGDCLASLFSNRQHMMLYLCLQGFVSVLAVMFFLTNMRPYESDLDTITPEIQTPRAVGQYQHGSARWMTDSEKDKAFDSYILDPHNPTIRQLLDTGYDGLDFLKEK